MNQLTAENLVVYQWAIGIAGAMGIYGLGKVIIEEFVANVRSKGWSSALAQLAELIPFFLLGGVAGTPILMGLYCHGCWKAFVVIETTFVICTIVMVVTIAAWIALQVIRENRERQAENK